MMGLTMDFTVEVMKWVEGKEKVWETIGPTRLIIYSWYRMALNVKPRGEQTEAELSITYEKPKGFFNRIFLLLTGRLVLSVVFTSNAWRSREETGGDNQQFIPLQHRHRIAEIMIKKLISWSIKTSGW